MQGTVFPRPHKWAEGRKGGRYKAPLRPNEEWTDPETGKVTKAGPSGSSWTWQLTTGSKTRGDRRTHSKGGYPTKKAAQDALTAALAAHARGDDRPLMQPSADLLGDYLRTWLEGRRDDLKHSTLRGYQNVITAWVAPRLGTSGPYRIAPYLGGFPMRDVGPDQLQRLFAALRKGGARKNQPLGTRSVHLVSTVLRMAFADAVEAGKLPYNPLDRIPRRQRPKHNPQKVLGKYWTPEEAATFVKATSTERLHGLYALALDSGARRGELSALRWTSLDLGGGVMDVIASRTLIGADVIEGTPKNGKTRKVDLDPRTVAALRQWKRRQAAERLAAGEVWTGGKPGETGYVFTDELGEPYRPDRLSTSFEAAQDGVGVPRIVFHALRHTSATLALSRGVPITKESERLGHSKVSITLDLYGHAIPSDGAKAAQIIGDAIYGTGTEGGL